MTTPTAPASRFDALEGVFFAIAPDPDFAATPADARRPDASDRGGAGDDGFADRQGDDMPVIPSHDRWSF